MISINLSGCPVLKRIIFKGSILKKSLMLFNSKVLLNKTCTLNRCKSKFAVSFISLSCRWKYEQFVFQF